MQEHTVSVVSIPVKRLDGFEGVCQMDVPLMTLTSLYIHSHGDIKENKQGVWFQERHSHHTDRLTSGSGSGSGRGGERDRL